MTILTGLCNLPETYKVVQSSKSVQRASLLMIPYLMRTDSSDAVVEVEVEVGPISELELELGDDPT